MFCSESSTSVSDIKFNFCINCGKPLNTIPDRPKNELLSDSKDNLFNLVKNIKDFSVKASADVSVGGYFFWEQQKAQEEAMKIAKQEAELSKKQAQEALKLADAEKIEATKAKKEFELAKHQANNSQKQIEVATKLAFEAQQKAEAQSRLTLAAKEQAENEKRKADELAQQLARQSATTQRNSNAVINSAGYLTCSRASAQYSTITDRFTKKISINTNAGKGTAVLRTNDTTERYTIEITSFNVKIFSDGYFNNDRSRAWIIRTEGKLTGSNINTSVAMSTIDDKNTIREMCQFSLAQY